MSDRPILFSPPMIRALLDGRKTQTRRVLKPRGNCSLFDGQWSDSYVLDPGNADWRQRDVRYAPGDRLWVREAAAIRYTSWHHVEGHKYSIDYAAGGGSPILSGEPPKEFPSRSHNKDGSLRWQPSIHMPRWASRITLIVTDVRVQRLQDISEGDAIAEGATSRPNCHGFQDIYPGWSMDWSKVGEHSDYATGGPGPLQERDVSLGDARMAFANYWDAINGPGAWDANPWVVAVSFEVHRCNIDQVEASGEAGRAASPSPRTATGGDQ